MPLPPPAHPLKVARYARWGGYSPRQWAVAFARTDWATDAQCLKSSGTDADPGPAVWRATLRPQKQPIDCIVKVEPVANAGEALRLTLGRSRFHRQWSGAETLHRAGILTGRPKALLVGGRGPLGLPWGRSDDDPGRRACLVLDALPGRTLLAHLADPGRTITTERALALGVATTLASLHQAGLRNRDHKPSNLIAVPVPNADAPTAFLCGIVDTMGISKTLPARKDDALHRMLASLVIEPTGIGAPPPRTTAMRLLRALEAALHPKGRKRASWRRFRTRTWRAVSTIVAGHADPTPTDDPLAP